MFSELPDDGHEEQTNDYDRWLHEGGDEIAQPEHGDLVDMSALAPVFEIEHKVFFTSLVYAFYVAVPDGYNRRL